jgi:hypothetical protein
VHAIGNFPFDIHLLAKTTPNLSANFRSIGIKPGKRDAR